MTLRSILAASLLLLPLLATAHNFVDGQRVAPVGVADRGELILDKDKFSYKNWNSAQLAGKVRVVPAHRRTLVSKREECQPDRGD
ncbi:protein ytfJ [Klebsiella pneumoniae subsp. ozaenae]|uniref:Protein ytfJ n=1 Tax=Klebsiella pneumoniae subsp. ozaenae TaxID=574 RepID=A0A378AZU7_KLEPO|nr:protein ytfJ [Klebsiella pneumoniae subsp. ozaenae]